MKLLLWLLLLVVAWPLALLVLVLWVLVWVVSLPLRLIGVSVGGVFELLRSILKWSARVIGGEKRRACGRVSALKLDKAYK